MVYYTNEWGGKFDTYEEAREATLESINIEDLAEYFQCYMTFEDLLEWAMKQPKFFNDFEDKVAAAENYFCDNYISEWEEENEEED